MTSNTFLYIYDTNPLDGLELAQAFLNSREYQWSSGPTAEDAVHDLPDWAFWSLGLYHWFKETASGVPGRSVGAASCAYVEPRKVLGFPSDETYFELVFSEDSEAVLDALTLGGFLPGDYALQNDLRTYLRVGADLFLGYDQGGNRKASVTPSSIARYGCALGCSYSSAWLQSVWRAMNIPAYVLLIFKPRHQLAKSNYSCLTFYCEPTLAGANSLHRTVFCPLPLPGTGKAMLHGDDIWDNENPMAAGVHRWIAEPVFQMMLGKVPTDEGALERLLHEYNKLQRAYANCGNPKYSRIARWTLGECDSEFVFGLKRWTCPGGLTYCDFESAVANGSYAVPDSVPLKTVVELRGLAKASGLLTANPPCESYHHMAFETKAVCPDSPCETPEGFWDGCDGEWM